MDQSLTLPMECLIVIGSYNDTPQATKQELKSAYGGKPLCDDFTLNYFGLSKVVGNGRMKRSNAKETGWKLNALRAL